MTKERLLYIGVLLAALASFGAVYQFYFKERLEEYARDERFKGELQLVYNNLTETFHGTDPETFTQMWVAGVQPWRQTLEDRAAFFTFGDWYDHDMPPEDVGLLRFWYDEVSTKMLTDLYAKASETPGLRTFPNDLLGMFGVASVNDWAGVNVTEQMVNSELANLSFGISVIETLLEAKVKGIFETRLWPKRTEKGTANILRYQTVGASILIETDDLVRFLENSLKFGDRFYTIDSMRISYPYLGQQYEPQLRVDFLFSQARFVGKLAGGNTAGASVLEAAGGGGGTASSGIAVNSSAEAMLEQLRKRREAQGGGAGAAAAEEEPGIFGKAWKLFKRYILYMN